MVVAFVWKIIPDTDAITSAADALIPTLALLVANVAMIAAVGTLLAGWGRRDQARIAARVAGTDAEPVAEAARG
jgi:hypothetical protein